MEQESDVGAVPAGEGHEAAERRRTRRRFIVQVAALRKTAGSVRREVRQGSIEGLGAVGVTVSDEAPVVCDLTLSSYPGGIMVTGTVGAPWTGECRRCGGPVSGTVEADVRERYAPQPDRIDDEDAYLLAGDELDLEPLARDAVMLDLPLAPLCSPDCLGLCPRCGENWNVAMCACPPEGDPRWSALDALRGPEGGSLA
jgi:uncharacterized protein